MRKLFKLSDSSSSARTSVWERREFDASEMSTSSLSDASLASSATASSNNTIESSRSMHSSLDNTMDSVSISSESTEYFSSSVSDPECLSNVPWSIYNVQEYFRDGPTSPCSTSSASITPTSASECPSRFQHLYLTRNVAFSELDLIDEYIRECLKKENQLLNEAKRNDSNIPKTSETSNKLGRSKKSRKRSADSDDSDDSSESEAENGHTDSEYLDTVYYNIPYLPKIKRITSEIMEASDDIDGLILLKKMHDDMQKNWRFDLSFSESISFMQSIKRRYAPFMPRLSSYIESPPDSPEKSPRSKVPRLSMEEEFDVILDYIRDKESEESSRVLKLAASQRAGVLQTIGSESSMGLFLWRPILQPNNSANVAMATNGVFVNPLQQTVLRPSNSNGRSHTAAQQTVSRPSNSNGRSHTAAQQTVSRPSNSNGRSHTAAQQTVSMPSNSNGRSHTAAQQRPLAYVRPDSGQPTGLVPHSSMERNRIQKKLDFINTDCQTPSAQPESHTENFLEFLRQPSSSVRFLTVQKMTNRLLSSYEFKPPQALCRPTRYPASIFSPTEWAIHLGLIARPPDINTLPRTSDSNILPRTSELNILPRTSDSNILPRTSDSNILPRTSDSNILPRTSDSNILPRTSDSNILPRTSASNILPRTSASNSIPRPPVSYRLARPEDRDPFNP